MTKWYNLTAFDIIGDLAFGEPFGGLKSSTYHSWVQGIFQVLRFIPFRHHLLAFENTRGTLESDT